MTDEKTPWNPSRRATARVPLPHMPAPTSCPHCGAGVELVKNSFVYAGREYGDWPWVYVCSKLGTTCDAYVGLHPFTAIPLGTLANAEEREYRKRAKSLFNPCWEAGPVQERFQRRTAAYAWLAEAMGISTAECHFGMFDVARCEAAISILRERRLLLLAHLKDWKVTE